MGLSTAMKFFGRQNSGTTSRDKDRRGRDNGRPAPAHRLTLNLTRAQSFARMLAKSRASRTVEVADLLAGMYICDWDRLSQYWHEHRRDEIERFLERICQISPQRWHAWIEFYDGERRKEEKVARTWGFFRRLRSYRLPSDDEVHESDALATVLRQAEQITPFHDRAPERSIPILTSECVLLCIARSFGTEITRKLAATGLDTAKLERDVFLPKRAPLA